MAKEDFVSEAFGVICELGIALGIRPLNEHPGCWAHQIDDFWFVAVNGHDESRMYQTIEIPPFHAYVAYDGWPAAMFTPRGGEFVVTNVVNEDAFIRAVRAAIARHKLPPR